MGCFSSPPHYPDPLPTNLLFVCRKRDGKQLFECFVQTTRSVHLCLVCVWSVSVSVSVPVSVSVSVSVSVCVSGVCISVCVYFCVYVLLRARTCICVCVCACVNVCVSTGVCVGMCVCWSVGVCVEYVRAGCFGVGEYQVANTPPAPVHADIRRISLHHLSICM